MKWKNILLLPVLSVLFSQNASAFCESSSTAVSITINPGNVKYITTMSRDDFIRQPGQSISPYTLGLTVAKLNITGDATPNVEVQNNKMCVSLSSVHINMGYDDLRVYIDKKYKPKSCEYKVIKNHENYHVAVAQQATVFFKKDIEKQVQDTLRKMKPQIVSTTYERDRVVREQFNKVIDDLRPLIEHINKVITKKNYQIDTPESYAATKKLCKHW